MRFKKIIFFFIISFLTWGLLAYIMTHYQATKIKMEKKISKQKIAQFNPKVIGWIPFWDQENAFESFSRNPSAFDFISVFWYRIDSSGAIKTYKSAVINPTIIDFAHKHNVKVLAVIANLADYSEGGGWDQSRVEKIISTFENRDKHINEILSLVDEQNLDGIDIDYEALQGAQRDNFSLFIEELGQRLHSKGKVLGVAVHPKTSESNPSENNGAHAQDLLRISKAADQMYFMTYTQHEISSEPGALGEIAWAQEVLSHAIEGIKVPSEKVFLGVGLNGVKWQVGDGGFYKGIGDDIKFSEVLSIAQTYNSQTKWDEKSKSPYLEYLQNEKKYVIWFENSESASARFELAKEFGVGGLAFWRLGGEDSQVWEEIKKIKNPKL